MSPFIHFLLSLVAALSMDLQFKRKYLIVLILGLLGVAPDLDHLIGYSQSGMSISIFHNLYLLGFLPILLMFTSFIVENAKGGHSSVYQRFFLALTVILVGHLVLDILAGNVITLHFPLDTATFALEKGVLINSGIYGSLLGTGEVIFGFWLLAIMVAHFAQKRLYDLSLSMATETRHINAYSLRYIIANTVKTQKS